MGLHWEKAEDQRVLDSLFQQQQHLLILTAMAAELQCLEIRVLRMFKCLLLTLPEVHQHQHAD